MPFRGRPNAPYLVPLTVRSMVQTKALGIDALCAAIADNGRRAFAL
jgi:TatD DNase family protein